MKYHAHLFFDLSEHSIVSRIRERIQFGLPSSVSVGPLLLREAGPLPKPMFQLVYDENVAALVYQVLERYREERSVLIHPVLIDELAAHTIHAKWLGSPLSLHLEQL
jgi:aromatic ring-cleaving dioxygenase